MISYVSIRGTYFLIFICLVLSGCATTKSQQEVILDEKTKTEYVFPTDEELKTCVELPLLDKSKKITPAETAKYIGSLGNAYDKCATDKDILAAWILRFKKEVSEK